MYKERYDFVGDFHGKLRRSKWAVGRHFQMCDQEEYVFCFTLKI